MSNDTVIRIENLSKQYRLGLVSTGTISHDINRWWSKLIGKEDPYLKIGDSNDRTSKGESDYVWALKDINLEVKRGERIGIIGKNGAGKSTLLKILSQVTGPTTGSVRMRGRVGALLEVGTGFHPELTGRENIYMNGTILGMKRWEVKAKLDEIVDFAGVERYLDTPVKRYSSGMMVRLGFAVAAHLEPDILIVDEVLAVGDAEFQKKAIGKMKDVSEGQGRTILFVSHNMGAIKTLCNNAILIYNGGIEYEGKSENVINKYLYSKSEHTTKTYSDNLTPKLGQEAIIRKVNILNSNEKLCNKFTQENKLFLAIDVEIIHPREKLIVGFVLRDKSNKNIFHSTNCDCFEKLQYNTISKGLYRYKCTLPLNIFFAGIYTLEIGLSIHREKIIGNLIYLNFTIESILAGWIQLDEQRKNDYLIQPLLDWKMSQIIN